MSANPPESPPTVDILGVGVSAINLEDAVAFVRSAIAGRAKTYICVRDAHGIIRCRDDAKLGEIHRNAGLVTPDGMPLVWLCRWSGARNVDRVYGPDLMLAACAGLLDRQTRHYFYGGAPGVAGLLAEKLGDRYEGLKVAGTFCPPFRDLSDEELIEHCARIDGTGADIVWVGLSSPKQEYWMARARAHLKAPVLVGVGAAFDFHSGTRKQAPRWIQRSGTEWLFRALTEPRRLGARYAWVVPRFAFLALKQALSHRRDSRTSRNI